MSFETAINLKAGKDQIKVKIINNGHNLLSRLPSNKLLLDMNPEAIQIFRNGGKLFDFSIQDVSFEVFCGSSVLVGFDQDNHSKRVIPISQIDSLNYDKNNSFHQIWQLNLKKT